MSEDIVDPLLQILPKDQSDIVFSQPDCEIEPIFLGFTHIYLALSKLIPKHFTVIDLGCSYNPQCFYFAEHKEYIGVDVSECVKWKAANCRIFQMTINEFIEHHLKEFNIDETFAICSYVPPWYKHDIKKVLGHFKNVFSYYPHGGWDYVNANKPNNTKGEEVK